MTPGSAAGVRNTQRSAWTTGLNHSSGGAARAAGRLLGQQPLAGPGYHDARDQERSSNSSGVTSHGPTGVNPGAGSIAGFALANDVIAADGDRSSAGNAVVVTRAMPVTRLRQEGWRVWPVVPRATGRGIPLTGRWPVVRKPRPAQWEPGCTPKA